MTTSNTYSLSLHDALPILSSACASGPREASQSGRARDDRVACNFVERSEENTSELQSRENLVCRLLLEKNILFVREEQAQLIFKCALFGVNWNQTTFHLNN